MSRQIKQFYEFANFRIDLTEKLLLRDGAPVRLTPKVFDTLVLLAENAGRLVEKDELMSALWPDRYVEEGNLAFNIKMLRKALGDRAARPRFVETVPCRGYRFIAEVDKILAESEAGEPGENGAAPENARPEPPSAVRRLSLAAGAALLIVAVVGGGWIARRLSVPPAAPLLSAAYSAEGLSTDGKVAHAVLSPDGKTVIYTVGTGIDRESVWLRHLETGGNVEIIPPSDDLYAGLELSPDGNFLYFVRRPRDVAAPAAVYRLSIFGGVPRKLVDETEGWISLSPDGERLSFVRCPRRDDEFCSLYTADAADGRNERRLVSRPRPFRIGDNRFAPDGKRLAFAAGQSENQANEFSLMEIELESGHERELTAERFFNVKNLVWLPDASALLVTASRIPARNFRIWQVSAATGAAEPLTKDSESYSALSLDGHARALVSTRVRGDFRLELRRLDEPATGRVLAEATAACFMPDGKIIFSSSLSGNDEIWSLDPAGGRRRQLTSHAADESTPVAGTDGRAIYFASNRSGAVQIWRMNDDGSDQRQITSGEGGFPLQVSPDGEWVYYHHGITRTLWRVAVKTGEERLVYDRPRDRFAVSPDGARAAFSERRDGARVITVISLADLRIVKTYRLADEIAFLSELVWLPDGKSLSYVSTGETFENKIWWLQPLDEERPRQIAALGDEELARLAPAPDGRTFAVVRGVWRHDAVLLKGLR